MSGGNGKNGFDFSSFYLRGLHPEFRAIEKRWKEKAESDAALIESLNRYIEALEGRAAVQAENITELQGRLDVLLAAYNHK